MSRIKQKILPQVASNPIQFSLSDSSTKHSLSVCICILLDDSTSLDIDRLKKLQKHFARSFVVFVDSSQQDNSNYIYERMSSCTILKIHSVASESEKRNLYLSFVVTNKLLFDVMMVVDPRIALSRDIPDSSFECCALDKYDSWDAVFANQSYKYYDIQNLRSEDCPSDLKELSEPERLLKIKQLKRHIPENEPYIPVISAFGGLALYKSQYLVPKMYSTDQHVSFNMFYHMHTQRTERKMFIVPSLCLETAPENAQLYI
jgi:hypothetical protein